MNRVNVFAIHRCVNEGYGLIRIFTEKIRISPTKLWRVCISHDYTVTMAQPKLHQYPHLGNLRNDVENMISWIVDSSQHLTTIMISDGRLLHQHNKD